MTKGSAHQVSRVVELSEGVAVRTNIKSSYLPALRAGFAGYPLNPRWGGAKIVAWKIGQQWRIEFKRGNLSTCTEQNPVCCNSVETRSERLVFL
ncbi:hypothetical protein [Oscillatoria sp. FACHB-1406]|uniref:hypothetical protein n=1 Tax=Oscillatoria sp. FACHB-1406 TaxID=2692846 RepID=UPI00168756B1|nr:hypothetical protein [Oscillatoria sp. FACHB-1406]MBD2577457.1 hypothetical protein [Oscillatoria sp. FACHB-1406]